MSAALPLADVHDIIIQTGPSYVEPVPCSLNLGGSHTIKD